jgi:two-component system, response regulator PdtaR
MIASAEYEPPLVLVVEDDDFLRLTSSLELAASGFRTLEARSADEALLILESTGSIDAIFTDISMPGSMNGLGLAHHVRRKKPWVYVLITSGDHILSEAAIPDQSDFVPKPYALPSIAEMLRRHIRRGNYN